MEETRPKNPRQIPLCRALSTTSVFGASTTMHNYTQATMLRHRFAKKGLPRDARCALRVCIASSRLLPRATICVWRGMPKTTRFAFFGQLGCRKPCYLRGFGHLRFRKPRDLRGFGHLGCRKPRSLRDVWPLGCPTPRYLHGFGPLGCRKPR